MNLQELRDKIPELKGLSDASAIDIIHQAYYQDMDKAEMSKRLGYTPPPPPVPTRTWGEAVTDTGRAAASGVGGLIKSGGELYGLASGNMDNGASELGDSVQKYWEDGQSAALKAKKANRAAAIEAADGQLAKGWTAFKETMTDPALAVDVAASNAATMIPGMAVGRLAAASKAARGLAAASEFGPVSGAARGAIAKAAGEIGTNAAIGAGAIQQAADVSGSGYEDAMKKPNEVWAQNPEFIAAFATTDGSEAALQATKHDFALAASRAAFVPAAAVSVLANKYMPSGDALERAMVGGAALDTIKAGAKWGLPKAVAKSALGEAAQETVEEGGGKFAANVANQRYVDPNQDLGESVGENAGMGAAGGFAMGGPSGVFHRRGQGGKTPEELANEAQAATNAAQAAQDARERTKNAAQAPNSPIARAAIAGEPATTVDPVARLAELELISKGTQDQTTFDADGNPVIVPGNPGRYFTTQEKAEYDALKAAAQAAQSPVVGTSTVVVDGKTSVKTTRQDGSQDIDGVQVTPPRAVAPPAAPNPLFDGMPDAGVESMARNLFGPTSPDGFPNNLEDNANAAAAEIELTRRRALPVINPETGEIMPPGTVAAPVVNQNANPSTGEQISAIDARARDEARVKAEQEAARVTENAAAGVQEGDVLNNHGRPFAIKGLASIWLRKSSPDLEVVSLAGGGYVLRKKVVNGPTDGVQPVSGTGVQPGGNIASTGVVAGTDAGTELETNGVRPAVDSVGQPVQHAGGVAESAVTQAAAPLQPTAPLDFAAHEAATSPLNEKPQPTQDQKSAGNYAKGHVSLNGLNVAIENPAGSVRSGVGKGGVPWQNTLNHHYGYVKGTTGADGDHVDMFIKPGTPLDYIGPVYVADQVDPDTGKFDEHKALVGFASQDEARAAYQSNYHADWTGLRGVHEMPFESFKSWVKDGTKRKPLGDVQADPKAKWLKAINDQNRLAGDTGVQLRVDNGKLTFWGDPNSTKQAQAIGATLAEARKAGASIDEIIASINAANTPASGAVATTPPVSQPQENPSVITPTQAVETKPIQAQAPEASGRPGYDTEVEVSAKSLQVAFERDSGEPLVSKPDKLAAWRNGTSKTNTATSPVEVGFTDGGKFSVNDGRHRIALAAERGENIKVMVDGNDVDKLKAMTPTQPTAREAAGAPTAAITTDWAGKPWNGVPHIGTDEAVDSQMRSGDIGAKKDRPFQGRGAAIGRSMRESLGDTHHLVHVGYEAVVLRTNAAIAAKPIAAEVLADYPEATPDTLIGSSTANAYLLGRGLTQEQTDLIKETSQGTKQAVSMGIPVELKQFSQQYLASAADKVTPAAAAAQRPANWDKNYGTAKTVADGLGLNLRNAENKLMRLPALVAAINAADAAGVAPIVAAEPEVGASEAETDNIESRSRAVYQAHLDSLHEDNENANGTGRGLLEHNIANPDAQEAENSKDLKIGDRVKVTYPFGKIEKGSIASIATSSKNKSGFTATVISDDGQISHLQDGEYLTRIDTPLTTTTPGHFIKDQHGVMRDPLTVYLGLIADGWKPEWANFNYPRVLTKDGEKTYNVTEQYAEAVDKAYAQHISKRNTSTPNVGTVAWKALQPGAILDPKSEWTRRKIVQRAALAVEAGFRPIEANELGLKSWEQLHTEVQEKLAQKIQSEVADEPADGASTEETEEISGLFESAVAAEQDGDWQMHHLFDAPAKTDIVRLNDKVRVYHAEHGWMTVDQAKEKIKEWQKHADQQGDDADTRRANSKKVVLSLFDLTGVWSQPWVDAGYTVFQFDFQNSSDYEKALSARNEEEGVTGGYPETGEYDSDLVNQNDVNSFSASFFSDMFGDFDGLDIHAVLAGVPCTDFASSGARHFAAKDSDGRTHTSVELVHQTLRVIEYFKPAIWAIENPVGRIEKLGGLPPWRLSFDPNHMGDPYTKKTLLWGRFNADLPVAPVEPTEGSKMHSQYGGSSQATKNARSVTPEGFAYSFFMANNAIDHPVLAIAGKYDRLDRGGIEAAVKAGVTEEQISEAVDDAYYQDQDDESANDALRDLTADAIERATPIVRKTEAARMESLSKRPAQVAPNVTDLQTYTTAEAKKEWDKLSPSRRRSIASRVNITDKYVMESDWSGLDAFDKKLLHQALNEEFFSPMWYINTKGQKVPIGPVIEPYQKPQAEIDSDKGAELWSAATLSQKYSALLNSGIGRDADQAQYTEWSKFSPEVKTKLLAALTLKPESDAEYQANLYGTVSAPLKFISGMSAPADFAAVLAANRNVGISINELSNVSIPKLATAMVESEGSHLFIDTGAFSVFMANMKATARNQTLAEIGPLFESAQEPLKGMNHDAIMERINTLHSAINKADGGGDEVANRVFIVMPDIVGDQAGSLALVKQYAEDIKAWHGSIVPLQGGELTLKQAYEKMMENLGQDFGGASPIIGIPSKAVAVSNEEFRELLDAYSGSITGIHILGAYAEKTLGPRLQQMKDAGYDGPVSADANRLRSLMWGDTTRAEAMRKLLGSEPAAQSTSPAVQDYLDGKRPDAPSVEEVNAEKPLAEQAQEILTAANVTGKERIDVLKDVKAGAITPQELKDAYPPAKPAQDLDSMFDDVLNEEIAKDKAAEQPASTDDALRSAVKASGMRGGDVYSLSGSSSVQRRQGLMSFLLGRKATQAESGVTALEKLLQERAGIDLNNHSAGRQDAFTDWLDGKLPNTETVADDRLTEPSITRRANPGNMADRQFVARAFIKNGDQAVQGFGTTEAEAVADLSKDADQYLESVKNTPKLDLSEPVVSKEEAAKDSDGNRIFSKGERVVVNDRAFVDSAVGRHGIVMEVMAINTSMVTWGMNTPVAKKTSYYYHVKTDGGHIVSAQPDMLELETGQAPEATPDVRVDGIYETPQSVLRSLDYARSSLRNAEGKLMRAKVLKSQKEHRLSIATQQGKIDKLTAAFDTWAKAHPQAAAEVQPKKAAPASAAPGGGTFTVSKTKHTKTGADLWVVKTDKRMEPSEYSRVNGLVKRNGGIWSNFTKGFNFSTEAGANDFLAAVGQTSAPVAAIEENLKANEVSLKDNPYAYGKDAQGWYWRVKNPTNDFGAKINRLVSTAPLIPELESLLAAKNREDDRVWEKAQEPGVQFHRTSGPVFEYKYDNYWMGGKVQDFPGTVLLPEYPQFYDGTIANALPKHIVSFIQDHVRQRQAQYEELFGSIPSKNDPLAPPVQQQTESHTDDLNSMFDDVLAEEIAKDAAQEQDPLEAAKEGIAQLRTNLDREKLQTLIDTRKAELDKMLAARNEADANGNAWTWDKPIDQAIADLADYREAQHRQYDPVTDDRMPGPSGYSFPSTQLVSRVQSAFEIKDNLEVSASAIGEIDGWLNFGKKAADGRYYIASQEKSITFDGEGTWVQQGHPENAGTYDADNLQAETIRVLTEQGAKPRVVEDASGQNDELDAEMRSYERKAGAPSQDMINEAIRLEVRNPGTMTEGALASAIESAKQRQKEDHAKLSATIKAKRSAAAAAGSAVKNVGSGLANAIDGLGKLFGTNTKGTLRTGLAFDEQTYEQAKPLFAAAIADFKNAGADLKESMRKIIRMVLDKFGADVAGNMKPYVIQYMADVENGLANPAENADTDAKDQSNGSGNTQEQDSQALDKVASEEDGATQDGRGVGRGRPGGSTGGESGNSGLDEPGVSGTRSGGSGSTSVRAPAPRGKRGRLGSEGTGRTGSKLPAKGSPAPELDLFSTPTEPVSAGNIQASNFRITEDVRLGQGGEAEKFRDNLAAIRTLKAIEAEGRRATSEEQRTLARYVGWGGLANAFPNPESKQWKPDWVQRGTELRDLLTQKEYDLARRSTLDSHYTSQTVVNSMWDAARRLGFKGGLAAETSMGIGNFIGLMPDAVAGSTRFIGVEYDSLTARMAALLYPQATVLHSGLQKVPLADNSFDLNIGNPPFGDQSLRFQFKPEFNRVSIHNQFFLAGIDSLKPGGLQLNVVSRYLLDAVDKTTRVMLAKRAKLVAAIRLPDTAFKENARTSVVTDIVMLQRLTPSEEALMQAAFDARNQKPNKDAKKEAERQALVSQIPSWVDVAKMPDPLGGEAMNVNSYFVDHPDMILGTLERSGTMQFKNDITVRPGAQDLSKLLAGAVAKLPEGIMDRSQDAIAASLERYKTMGDALKIALSGQEAGSLAFTPDGTIEQVLERETPEGDYELSKRILTPESPWSESLYQDAKGNWYTIEAKLDAQGNNLKVAKNGKPTNLNVYDRKNFASEADIPVGMLLGQTKFDRLKKMVKLRDLMVAQINLETEDAPKAKMEANRLRLATAYNNFVAEEGFISRPANSALVANMPDGALVQALELSYRKAISAAQAKKTGDKARPEFAQPAPILSERVIPKYEPPTNAASPADALSIVLSESGRVDMARIASLLGKTEEEVAAEMFDQSERPLIFKDPETAQWVTRNDYLTGQVKKKLHAAQAAGLARNVSELEAVQPEPWGAENVTVLLGSTFVPPQIYADFIEHITGNRARVSFAAVTNSFAVVAEGNATQEKQDEYGADGVTISTMISDMLNSTPTRIIEHDSDGNPHVNHELTALALIKARQIANEFTDWAFADGARRNTLVSIFNEKYNTRVNRQHDGSHLTLPGKVPDAILRMRRHQKNAIWRGISERFMLLDHVVGAGKTFTAIARAMERRRMGLSRKPMIVVPNHLVEQFSADVYRLYPGAKVLAAGKADFEKSRRRKVFAKIASGDWDIVIVPHSSFGFIGIAAETEERYLEQELVIAEQAVQDAWEEAGQSDNASSFRKPFNVKSAERLRDKITARMESVRGNINKDRLLTFEQMGVDDLTVDEAHEFKNLFYSSRLTGVKGMGNPSGSQKAFDLYSKVRVLRESPTGTVTFMTGTPISNSAVEMFNMMRYLAADELKELGLEHFDAWRSQFVSTDAAWEPNETGRLRQVNRLGRSWSNMRSLMDLYYSFTDSVSNDDIKKAYPEDNNGKQFPIPKVKGGERQQIVLQPTQDQIQWLEQTMQEFDDLPSIKDPYDRNIARLQLMDRARKLSLDVRSAVPGHQGQEKGGKLERISAEVKRVYDKWTADKGTQLVFLDRSVPKAKGDAPRIRAYDALLAERVKAIREDNEEALRRVTDKLEKFDSVEMEELRIAQNGGWNAYQQIKDNLIALGVPAREIRFIQEANNDAQKQALFDAVNAGEVRVLIGSTQRMGAGTNVQQRMVGLHHGDVTWKPSDIEQREGRGIRQGNWLLEKYGIDNFELEILAYATERSIDAKMWALNSAKLKTINAIRNYDGSFSMDFEDADSVGMAEMAALASGNPKLLERVKLDSEINNLELLKRQHQRKMWGYKGRLEDARRDIERAGPDSDRWNRLAAEAQVGVDETEADFASRSIAVEGKEYSNRKDAMRAVVAAIDEQQAADKEAKFSVRVGERRLTSQTGALRAIDDALGDATPFLATVGSTKYVSRTDLARDIAKAAVDAVDGMVNNGDSKMLLTGRMGGFKFEAELAHSWGAYRIDLALVDSKGSTVNSSHSSSVQDGSFLTSHMVTPVGNIFVANPVEAYKANADFALRNAERAEREIPDLREKAAQPFAHAAELAEKNARLERVIAELSATPVKVAAEDVSTNLRFTGAPEANETDVVFARGRANGPGMTRKDMQDIVDTIKARWKNAPEIVIASSMDDAIIPQGVKDYEQVQRSLGAKGSPQGFVHGGKVYLLADQLSSPGAVVRVMLHESLGHVGLRGVFGQGLTQVLNQIILARRAEVEAKARQYGLDITNKQDMQQAAEEVLAELAQTRPDLGLVKRAIAAIRTWLRENVSYFKDMELTDAEIVNSFILPARRFIESRTKAQINVGGNVQSRSAGNWYSELSKQVLANKATAMPAGMWAAWINTLSTKGVKPAEIEWSGVQDWLKMQTGKVTKADVLAYLDANGVQVQETTLFDDPDLTGEKEKRAELEAMSYEDLTDEADSAGVFTPFANRQNAIDDIINAMRDNYDGDSIGDTKYGDSNLVLPGGTNYREVLLTLPERPPSKDEAAQAIFRLNYDQLGPNQRLDADRLLKENPRGGKENYQSSHWQGTPNVLAHIRLNDRTDADGKRVLFVEEIQSDWGQAGKKYGFNVAPEQGWRVLNRNGVQMGFSNTRGGAIAIANGVARNLVDGESLESLGVRVEQGANSTKNTRIVPNAPFVGKTDAWVSLAIKRIIKMAVDGGYDKVAFVNGEQSAERYDLSKQISRVEYHEGLKGQTGTLEAFDHGGQSVIARKATHEELPDLIGKEIAAKLVAQKADNGGARKLSGLDLKVGGEGMEVFYDQIVPNTTKDVLRKLGGGKMETVQFKASLPNNWTTLKDNGEWIVYDENGTGMATSYSELAAIDKAMSKEDGMKAQPGFTITEALREKAGEGMPLFQRGTDGKSSVLSKDGSFKGWPKFNSWTRAEYNHVVSLLPAEYRNDPHRQEPLPAKDWDALAQSVVPQLEAINETVGAGTFRLDSLGNIQADARKNAPLLYLTDVIDIADRQGLGIYITGIHVESIQKLSDLGFVSEFGLAPIVQREAERKTPVTSPLSLRSHAWAQPPMPMAEGGVNNPAYGTVMSYKPRGFSKVLFSRSNPTKITGDVPQAINSAATSRKQVPAAMKQINWATDTVNLDIGAGRFSDATEFLADQGVTNLEFDPFNRSEQENYDALDNMLGFNGADTVTALNVLNVIKEPGARANVIRRAAKALNVEGTAYFQTYEGDKSGKGAASRDGWQENRGTASYIKEIEKHFGTVVRHGQVIEASDPIKQKGDTWENADGSIRFSRGTDQTETPKFKKWFGESKVVDADGKPLVVYHGTASDITEFRRTRSGEFGPAIYTTSDPAEAASYADGAGGHHLSQPPVNVMPLYVSLKNPFTLGVTVFWNRYNKNDGDAAAVQRAIADGFDGVIEKRVDYRGKESFTHYIAFDPSQIKSAAGNNGNFDGTNPDIRFSRGPVAAARDTLAAARELNLAAGYKLGDLLKFSSKTGWWDRTVGTQFNLAQRNKEFKRVYDGVQTFLSDVSTFASRAANLAPTMLPQLNTLADLRKKALSPQDVVTVSAPVFEGTLNYTRDENGDAVESSDVSTAGVVWTPAELKDKFGLTGELNPDGSYTGQIGLYREFRAAIDQSLTTLAISDMIRFGGADLEPIASVLMDSPTVQEAQDTAVQYLESVAEEDAGRADALADTAEGINNRADKALSLMARGYAPLSRFGKYAVYVEGEAKEQLFFGMYETQREANRAERALVEEFPDAKVTSGVMSQEQHKLFQGVTPETLALFGEAIGLDPNDPQSALFQQYLKLVVNSRSAIKRMIKRKGVAGYSEDASRVLAGFVTSNARRTSSNLNAGAISRAANEIEAGDVKDQAIKLKDYVENPQEEAQGIRGLLFTQYIGGSISSALINLTQPLTMTMPYLAQFIGVKAAPGAMVEAFRMAATNLKTDPDLAKAMKRAEEDGTVMPQEIHQLQAQAGGRGALRAGDGTRLGNALATTGNAYAKFQLAWGKMFSAAEQFNRRVTFIAAYKIAREQKMRDPFAFAEHAINETQGVYNKGNKPQIARGAIGATLMTFKQYSISYMEFLYRMYGNGPEGKKAVGMALAVLFLTAGLGGMPGADDIDDLLDGIMQHLGYNFSSKQKKKEFFALMLGSPAAAEFMLRGLSGLPGVPLDVSGRMGVGNLIPGTGIFTKKADHASDLLEFAGPAGDMAKRTGAFIGHAMDARPLDAAADIVPTAGQNILKGIDMLKMGMYRDSKANKVVVTDPLDAVIKMSGFQPNNVARIQQGDRVVQEMILLTRLVESEISDRMAQGRFERNQSKIDDAQDKLNQWNRNNPESRIVIQGSQINSRVQNMNRTKAQRITRTAPKEIRATVRRELVPQ